jgi:hypothetical protein
LEILDTLVSMIPPESRSFGPDAAVYLDVAAAHRGYDF